MAKLRYNTLDSPIKTLHMANFTYITQTMSSHLTNGTDCKRIKKRQNPIHQNMRERERERERENVCVRVCVCVSAF